MKGPVEITLTRERDIPANRRAWWRRDDDYVDDGDVGVLQIGRGLAAVETTFSTTDEVTRRWLSKASADGESYWGSGANFSPNNHANPIRCVALCLGGSRALVYCPETYGYRDPKERKPAYPDPLKFYENNMARLRAFLDDNRITVACFGAREVTRKLAREWGLHVAFPEELTDLFALAYGDVAGVQPEERQLPKKPAKYWMGKAALKREKAKAKRDEYDTDEEERLNNLGRTWRPPKVVRGLSLERMARVALGPEMRLARCPPKVAHADWGNFYDLAEDKWAYATRDAYLCFEIAARCLQKLGDPIGPGSSSVKPAVAPVGMARPTAVLSH